MMRDIVSRIGDWIVNPEKMAELMIFVSGLGIGAMIILVALAG